MVSLDKNLGYFHPEHKLIYSCTGIDLFVGKSVEAKKIERRTSFHLLSKVSGLQQNAWIQISKPKDRMSYDFLSRK